MAVVRLLPQGEVEGILLLVLAVESAGLVLQLVDLPSAEGPVVVGFGKFPDIEVDAAVGFVGEPVVDGSSGALVVPKYGESSALTSFAVGDNPTEDDWACMPMELKGIVEMQAQKGKIEQCKVSF